MLTKTMSNFLYLPKLGYVGSEIYFLLNTGFRRCAQDKIQYFHLSQVVCKIVNVLQLKRPTNCFLHLFNILYFTARSEWEHKNFLGNVPRRNIRVDQYGK